jgi:ribosome-binding protein aMBF1 (putative translation factor)
MLKKHTKRLPNKVRQLREKAGLSPKELAAQIGGEWTASTVRRIGARCPQGHA